MDTRLINSDHLGILGLCDIAEMVEQYPAKWILFLNEHISNQETLLQCPCKNKMEGGGNEFNSCTGCPCDL